MYHHTTTLPHTKPHPPSARTNVCAGPWTFLVHCNEMGSFWYETIFAFWGVGGRRENSRLIFPANVVAYHIVLGGAWEAPLPPSNDGAIKFMTLKLGLLDVVCFSFPGWASVSCILFGEVYDTRMGVVFRCLVLKTGRTVGRTKRPITSTFDDNFHGV